MARWKFRRAVSDPICLAISLYQQLESDRGRLLFEFGLVYLGLAIIVILASVWGALWFAERLSRPVGRLAAAAERVGEGDLDAKVPIESSNDEIGVLGTTFNRMTEQLKDQRQELVGINIETERQRRLFDSVLSGVTAGILGLDAKGRVETGNRAAEKLLNIDLSERVGQGIDEVTPEFSHLFHGFLSGEQDDAVSEIELRRRGQVERLLVRVGARSDHGQVEGYVITFDDITALVAAQRMAAWGDVARRIAHEIKNPLTPIKLSAERMRRKFGAVPGVDSDAMDQYVDVIVRQTEDLRRIVDEFSKFARMPAAELRRKDILPVLRDATYLAESANPGIGYRLELPEFPVVFDYDETMMSQAFNNILKNASEAIEARIETGNEAPGAIDVTAIWDGNTLVLSVKDNGIGLPEDRSNLAEPYVTHRDEGTGLGLSIVKKIVEEHGGNLDLRDAPSTGTRDVFGAEVRMTFADIGSASGEAGADRRVA